MVHTPKRAAHKTEQVLDSPSHGKTGLKLEELIIVGPKRLPNSPFPKVSPIPYHRLGTPYRKVDLPGTETEVVPETLGAGILDKAEDSFEVDSESETKISMDIKHMPASHGYSYILVLLCEVSNYMVALPLHSTRTRHSLQVFQKGYVAYFGPPTHIVCDQDASFTSSIMHAFTEQLNIKVIF